MVRAACAAASARAALSTARLLVVVLPASWRRANAASALASLASIAAIWAATSARSLVQAVQPVFASGGAGSASGGVDGSGEPESRARFCGSFSIRARLDRFPPTVAWVFRRFVRAVVSHSYVGRSSSCESSCAAQRKP